MLLKPSSMPSDEAKYKALVCVSIGQHPQSGRERRADQDGRAVEMGLNLQGRQLVDLSVVHAGQATSPVLRQYAGMGLSCMTVLSQHQGDDALSAMLDYVKDQQADFLLMGTRSETGESSGLLPYLLAEKLGWPLVPRIAEIQSIEKGVAQILLALPRGQRRSVAVSLPFVATVDNAATAARQTAFGPGMRANIEVVESLSAIDQEASEWQFQPAKARSKRMKVVKAKSAADRFKAATAKAAGGGGKVMKNESVEEKANAIFDFLLEEKVIR
ncbi:electron transfer flavoprotein subunit beta [Marinomonas posidonica]|uniref:Electron transfer flavoprotein alpha/beta-subunit n=1 Tax=Marinomonas posidonica (strain CECT 7376 / NCIMB 14433 / IVIA-Po-181) TaxID=491952 RepID=F6CWR0_MARPP|nr:electron transfer flavoprotein subunit beta [Marinomonas posidonica]AEF54410.1 Electron transfer flavoprotein alpha/beta-subunit [Marinomonas posidonica IVIA-Po-181]